MLDKTKMLGKDRQKCWIETKRLDRDKNVG